MIAGIMSPIGDLPPSTRFLTIEQVSLVMSSPNWTRADDLHVCDVDTSTTEGSETLR